MQTEPEIISGHTDLMNSTNIKRIVTGHDAVRVHIGQLVQQLNAIFQLTAGIGICNVSD